MTWRFLNETNAFISCNKSTNQQIIITMIKLKNYERSTLWQNIEAKNLSSIKKNKIT